ncbi:class I SAM-dependent methyltransferase [Litoreibacter sp.]|nr:class I SAM-dependent methyltransferase [Litoreibacter sp.]
MNKVKEQYEAYPYPERDPRDEKKRLITGSPSHPLELDHFLFRGQRDWSQGTRILVAGGGTGDALIQLAQTLTTAKAPYEITYIDLSTAARKIAEARAKARGLTGITFITGSILDAEAYGPFDYIDCCGVLHHLPNPQLGFDALAAALTPDGGLGCMVYAPYGRAGVYPLQQAFTSLLKDLPVKAQLKRAKQIFAALPEGHPFKRNPHLVDHNASDAGFYDLLLHSQDQPFAIDTLCDSLQRAGLRFAGTPQAALYDLSRFSDVPDGMSSVQQMALAERLDGTIKAHVIYAQVADREDSIATGTSTKDVPHLKGMTAQALAQKITRDGKITVTLNGEKHHVSLAKQAAKVIAGIDGRRDLEMIRQASGLDPLAFKAIWAPVHRALTPFGLMIYSRLLR